MEKEHHKYFKGLKRQMAKAAAQGEISAKTGKDPLSFELYSFLCEKLLVNPSKNMACARTYVITAWHLMCHGRMEWSGDAFCIYFAHQKMTKNATDHEIPGTATLTR
ncbi:hypothetical protein F443_07521 [Phytophthora nicotianae P1569]|uniref:Uncharacterized protein n=1 Tax=Phytophthora nicotianae P1569 TaxID=1317065 RepID=V9FDH5_PHYNI|nr:hypothetical protein F443_07521 [Phytophthora nicotianae P1569]